MPSGLDLCQFKQAAAKKKVKLPIPYPSKKGGVQLICKIYCVFFQETGGGETPLLCATESAFPD